MILDNPEFLEARARKGYYFFGNIGLPTLTWEDAVSSIDFHLQKKAEGHDGYITTYRNGGLVLFQGHRTPKVEPLHLEVRQLAKQVEHKSMSSQLYISMSSVSGTHGRHIDPRMDVFIWHQIGRVDYIVDDKEHIKMKPGDMLYITKGIPHEPVIHTPRVTVSTAIEY